MDWIDDFVKHLLKGELEEAYDLRYNKIPKRLYRFEKVDNTKIETLKKQSIYLAGKGQFNDVNECRGAYISEKFIDNLTKNNPFFTKEELYQYQDDCTKYARMCCFTEDIHNFPMWWSYADEHKGYCVEYDFKQLIDANRYEFVGYLYPVKYITHRICVDKLYDNLFKRIETSQADFCSWDYALIYLLFCMKHISWSYEKEWRYISFREDKTFEVLPVKPKAIYLGMKMSTDNIEKMREVASILDCKLYKINKLDDTSHLFKFEVLQV